MRVRLNIILLALILSSFISLGQNKTLSSGQSISNKSFISEDDVFGTRVFVENKGQYDKSLPNKDVVLFVYDHGGEKIYFTPIGLVYELSEKKKDLSEEEREREEKESNATENRAAEEKKQPKLFYVYMNWQNTNANISIQKEQKQSHHFTYGAREFNSSTYKKIIYKNVYNQIDIEFCMPVDKKYGIKYNVILHSGANANDIVIAYSGDIKKTKLLSSGDLLIKTPAEDITEHAPHSFYSDGQVLVSKFDLKNDYMRFDFPDGLNNSKTVVVDPWITAITTLSTNNCGYDVDFDNAGNTFVYGGTQSFKTAMYSSSGVLQWTFLGSLAAPAWTSTGWPTGILVEKTTSKCFVARMNSNNHIIRLDPSGNYDNFISSGGNLLSEVGDMNFTCTGDILLFGGAFASGIIINIPTATVTQMSFFQPIVTCCQDIVCETRDGMGNFFVLYGSGGPTNILANKLSAVGPTYNSNLWTQPTSFGSFAEVSGRTALPFGATGCTWFKCLAVNNNYLYYYDGLNLAAYSKATGTQISSTTVPGHNLKQQGGIAVDDCNNLYLGGNTDIRCYNFNGVSFSTLTAIPLSSTLTNQYIYDLVLNKATNNIHITGSGLAGVYPAVYSSTCSAVVNSCSCIQPYLSINTVSTNCGNIGTSTVNVGGMPGPYTYTWLPGGQTSSVITAMNPGTYTVSATSTSCNITTSAITIFTSSLPGYVLSVPNTSITCASLGSATVNLTGIPGPFSYTWNPTAQTGSVVTGLSPGTYTLTVFSASCNLTFTTTTSFISLVPLTATIAYDNSVACNGANTATGSITNMTGGSGTQTFLWTNGNVTYTTAFTNSLSMGIWTANVTDLLTGCQVNQLFFISEPAAMAPLITASSPTTCVGTAITFTAFNSGGVPGPGPGYTYTWTGGPISDTYAAVQSIANNYIYTVTSSDANSCLSSATIAVNYVPNPTLTVANVSICPLQTGTLSVGGASSYTWNPSTPLSLTGSTFTQSPAITTQYSVVGTALSCTSAATASIILKPVPVPVFSSNSPICNGQNLVFSVSTATAAIWTGVGAFSSASISNTISSANPGHSGAYQVTVTAANSCTASTSGNTTVNPTPTIAAVGSTVCVNQTMNLSANSLPGATYQWNGPSAYLSLVQNPSLANPLVSASGNYTLKVVSAVGCSNTAVVNVTVTPLPVVIFNSNSPQCLGNTLNFNSLGTTGALIYSWSGPNGFSSALVNPNIPNVTVPASGDYTLVVTRGPCVASVTHPATIHPLPTPLAFNNAPVCEGKNFYLGVNNSGVIYQWFGPAGFSSLTQNQTLNNVTLAQSGNYMVTVTDANSCQASSTTSVTILINPTLTTTGDMVCIGSAAQLSAQGANTYYWFGPGNFIAGSSHPVVAPTVNSAVWTYTVVGTAVNGCTAIATATIGTRVLPVPSLTITPRICVGAEIKLQGQGGVSYQWYGPLNFYSPAQTSTLLASNIGMAGTYTLIVTDAAGCKNYTMATVLVDAAPVGVLNGDLLEGCVPFCSNYSLMNVGTGSISNTFWQINNQTFNTNSFYYCFYKSGDFILKGSFQDDRNCKADMNFVIKVHPKPEADFEFSPITPIENDDQVLFINTSKGELLNKWHWAFINNAGFTADTKNTSYTFEDAGSFVVAMVVRNTWGCPDTIIKTIEVLPDFHIYIPNSFTPNGDDLNDRFFPVMRGVKKYSMQIFDRWGEIIFATTEPTNTWDGKFKGIDCKQDVYNYKISVIAINGEEKTYAGSTTLLR